MEEAQDGFWVRRADRPEGVAALREIPEPSEVGCIWLEPADPDTASASLVGVAAESALRFPSAQVLLGPVDPEARPLLRLAEDLATLCAVSGARAGLVLARGPALEAAIELLRRAWDGDPIEVGAAPADAEARRVVVHPEVGDCLRIPLYLTTESESDHELAGRLELGTLERAESSVRVQGRAASGALALRLAPERSGA